MRFFSKFSILGHLIKNAKFLLYLWQIIDTSSLYFLLIFQCSIMFYEVPLDPYHDPIKDGTRARRVKREEHTLILLKIFSDNSYEIFFLFSVQYLS